MIRAWEKVKEEMEIWRYLFNKQIIRLYEITDDPNNDMVFLTTEYAAYGTIADYNEKEKKMQRNYSQHDAVLAYLIEKDDSLEELEKVEQLEYVASYLF